MAKLENLRENPLKDNDMAIGITMGLSKPITTANNKKVVKRGFSGSRNCV